MRAVRVAREDIVGDQNQAQPGAGIQRADLRQKVWEAAARMPARPRRLLLRRELEGLSYSQIGADMGISTQKVRRRLHRARALFRKKYAPYLAVRDKGIKCRRLGDLLSGYYDGELRGMGSRQVADHLAQCADCRRAEERLASTSELLATLAPTPAPPGLADRLFTSKAKAGVLPMAGGGGTIWRLALMLLVGGGFIAGVIYLAAMVWDGGGSSGPVVAGLNTPTPTATPRVYPTQGPREFAVLTPAPVPTLLETVTATVVPGHTATPVPPPAATASLSPSLQVPSGPLPPTATSTKPPTAAPSASPSPTIPPTPSPTPEPSPGGVAGAVTCEGRAVSGAQVTIGGGGGPAWVVTTGADGSFDTGLVLAAGSYVVSIGWSGGTFDSAMARVPDGGYAYVGAECTGISRPFR